MFYTNRNQHTTSASAHAAEAAFSCAGSMHTGAAAMSCNSIVSILDAILASIFVTLISLIGLITITLVSIRLISVLVLLALVLVVLLHNRTCRNRS